MFKREYSIRSVRVHSKRYLERVRVQVWYSMIFVVSDIFAFEVKSKLDREAQVVEMTCFFFVISILILKMRVLNRTYVKSPQYASAQVNSVPECER